MKVRTQGKEGVIRRISELHGLRQEEGYESQPSLAYSGKGIRSGMSAPGSTLPRSPESQFAFVHMCSKLTFITCLSYWIKGSYAKR